MQHSNDSINWPPEFSELKRLDVILKCGICYDFMNNCMITSCSHTYCSLCIRKFMQYKNQCPTCYEETYEINLRNNRLLDEVILIYTKIRDKLLRASRLASVNIPPKYETNERKTENKELLPVNAASNTSNSSAEGEENENKGKPTKEVEENKPLKLLACEDDSVVVNGVKIPGMFTSPKISCTRPRKPEELAHCPVCQVKVPAKNINIHLDSCLALDPGVRPKPKPRKRSPLPKRVYTMMPEKNLKKFLKEYGLSTSGDRKALIARLQRYTVIYNAENDAVNPRPIAELIKQLEREEREEKKPNTIMKNIQTAIPRITIPKNDIEAIEKANKAYCDENKASFKKLIEEMRARAGKNIKPLKPTNRIYSDDEDDPNRIISMDQKDIPTTSGCNLYSKETEDALDDKDRMSKTSNQNEIDISSDSDEDIFLASDPEEKDVIGKIDWNKTAVSVNETPESIYDLMTQNPSSEVANKRNKSVELEEDELFDTIIEDKSRESLSTAYSDSDNSIFDFSNVTKNGSIISAIENTPKKKKSQGIRRRLSLSCKKKEDKRKRKVKRESVNEEIVNDEVDINFSDNEVAEENSIIVNGNNEEHTQSNEYELSSAVAKVDNDNAEPKDDGSSAEKSVIKKESANNQTLLHSGESDKSLVQTPMKRVTRSAKRKSTSNVDTIPNELNTTPVTTKKTKIELSPTFD